MNTRDDFKAKYTTALADLVAVRTELVDTRKQLLAAQKELFAMKQEHPKASPAANTPFGRVMAGFKKGVT